MTAGDGTTLASVLFGGGDAAALICPDDGSRLGFDALADSVQSLAGSLAALGVGRGDRVALALGNGPEIVQLLLAVTALGAAAAPLNPAYTSDEFAFYLLDLGPRLLLLPWNEVAAARDAGEGVEIVDVVSGPGPAVRA